MKLLFVGDVVGSPGRKGLREAMPGLLERHAPDLAIVNDERTSVDSLVRALAERAVAKNAPHSDNTSVAITRWHGA